jgi:putative ABC transport system substrate-binding protein
MTNLSLMAVELNGKHLELPRRSWRVSALSIIGHPEHPGAHFERAFSEETGKRLGLSIECMPTRNLDELATALRAMAQSPSQAITMLADGFAVQTVGGRQSGS